MDSTNKPLHSLVPILSHRSTHAAIRSTTVSLGGFSPKPAVLRRRSILLALLPKLQYQILRYTPSNTFIQCMSLYVFNSLFHGVISGDICEVNYRGYTHALTCEHPYFPPTGFIRYELQIFHFRKIRCLITKCPEKHRNKKHLHRFFLLMSPPPPRTRCPLNGFFFSIPRRSGASLVLRLQLLWFVNGFLCFVGTEPSMELLSVLNLLVSSESEEPNSRNLFVFVTQYWRVQNFVSVLITTRTFPQTFVSTPVNFSI